MATIYSSASYSYIIVHISFPKPNITLSQRLRLKNWDLIFHTNSDPSDQR